MEEAPRQLTPPPIQAPTAKEKKYDRQLRLWAAAGQRALEESHVLLIIGEEGGPGGVKGSNSSVAGAETLKNLVLPGIGSFTIADSATVTEEDLGINFFLESESLDKSRAEEMTRLLQELNPDVTGHSIKEPSQIWIPRDESLRPFNLIISCGNFSSDIIQRLSNYAFTSSIPSMYIQSIGFYSSFSVQIPSEFPVVDTHPDPETIQDLRLLKPWPELEAEVDAVGDMKAMEAHDHEHIAYILILLHYLRQWREEHEGLNPETFKTKTEFREMVRSGARTSNSAGGEENFDEAVAAVLKAVSPPSRGSGCREMLDMSHCKHPNKNSASFWLIANAIRTFYDNHKVLPLPGTLPDMKARSSDYIRLQNVYKSKARADAAEVTASVRKLENSLHRSIETPQAEIEQFCKNAAHVQVLSNPEPTPLPIVRLMSLPTHKSNLVVASIKSAMGLDFEDVLKVFVALNSDHLPAASALIDEDDEESDTKLEALEHSIEEVRRARQGELHNISSVTGGMVAQEAIKLITRQYVPVDGTVVWDGIRGKVGVFKI